MEIFNVVPRWAWAQHSNFQCRWELLVFRGSPLMTILIRLKLIKLRRKILKQQFVGIILANQKMPINAKAINRDCPHLPRKIEWTLRKRFKIQMSQNPFNRQKRCQLFHKRTTSDLTVFNCKLLANKAPIQCNKFRKLANSHHHCIRNKNITNTINTETTTFPQNVTKMKTKSVRLPPYQKKGHDIEREIPAQTLER